MWCRGVDRGLAWTCISPMTLSHLKPFLTRRRGGSCVRGEKTGHRHPARHKVCPHRAAITHLHAADWLAAIMRVWALNDYELPGSHARSLSFQRQPKAREPASDGQPENLVGRFWLSHTLLNTTTLTVGAAEGCDLLTLAFTTQKQDQKIAAFSSSYRGIGLIQLETGRLSGRHRQQTAPNAAQPPHSTG